jgi:hypothetical protein
MGMLGVCGAQQGQMQSRLKKILQTKQVRVHSSELFSSFQLV